MKTFKVVESAEITGRGLALFFERDDQPWPSLKRFQVRITRPNAPIRQFEAYLNFARVAPGEVVAFLLPAAKRDDVPPGSLVSIIEPPNQDLRKSSCNVVMRLRQEAEERAVALQFGFDGVEDAVAWADANVAALDQPPYALLEICLAGKSPRHEVMQLLRSLPGEADESRACQQLLARMSSAWDEQDAKAERVASILHAMHAARLLNAAAAEEWSRLEYAADLVDAGIDSNLDDAVIDVGKLLRLATEPAAGDL